MTCNLHFFGANQIPPVGLGTYAFEAVNTERFVEEQKGHQSLTSVEEIVRYAIGNAGYRHIDTAHAYNNEEEIGRGMRRAMEDFGIQRY